MSLIPPLMPGADESLSSKMRRVEVEVVALEGHVLRGTAAIDVCCAVVNPVVQGIVKFSPFRSFGPSFERKQRNQSMSWTPSPGANRYYVPITPSHECESRIPGKKTKKSLDRDIGRKNPCRGKSSRRLEPPRVVVANQRNPPTALTR